MSISYNGCYSPLFLTLCDQTTKLFQTFSKLLTVVGDLKAVGSTSRHIEAVVLTRVTQALITFSVYILSNKLSLFHFVCLKKS